MNGRDAPLMKKKTYANGQNVFEIVDNVLTYFFKTGVVKAKGTYANEQMDGEWIFYRETGQLWQIGNFKKGEKHGIWKRFDRNDQLEYEQEFIDGKPVRKR